MSITMTTQNVTASHHAGLFDKFSMNIALFETSPSSRKKPKSDINASIDCKY